MRMNEHGNVRHSQERQARQLGQAVPGSRVVAELQRALLPAALPVLSRVRIAAHYLAARSSQQAGGDWFDAIALPGGHVALLVGDVVGQGVPAVAAMGQLRSVLGELLAAERDLRAVVRRADAFATRIPDLRSASLAVADLDQATGSLRYITCGHPPPLVIGPDGGTRLLPVTGTGPLGTASEPVFGQAALQPGELLLLYSDGLIQRPQVPVAESIAELREAAEDAVGAKPAGAEPAGNGAAVSPPERVCQHALAALAGRGYADDVTALAAEFVADPVPELNLEFAAEVGNVLQVRRAFAAWLRKIDAAVIDANDLLLAVVETVTNAVEHAYREDSPGMVRFRAALREDGTLECQVADHGRWQRPNPANGNRGHGLMVASQVVDTMRISHAMPPAGSASGSHGTVVTLRHRLYRPASVTTDISDGPAEPYSATAFRMEIESHGAEPCAKVSGPVDGSTADRLAKQLLTACRGGTLPITLDLTGITYLASSGIRAIYQVKDRLTAHQQHLTILAAPNSSAQALLDMARLPHLSS
jgi:anti-anti-sigma factor